MKRHLRLAAVVLVGFLLLVLSPVVGSFGGVGIPTGLILGVLGILVVLVAGFAYTALFVREFVSGGE